MMAEVNTKDLTVLEKVSDDMLSVVEDVAQKGVTQEEVDRARQRSSSIASWRRLTPTASPSSSASGSAQGDWRLYFLNRDRIEQVTPEQVKQVAAQLFHHQQSNCRVFHPNQESRENAVPPVPDIAKLVDGYAGRQLKAMASETSDVSPLAIEARLIRPDPIGGIKLAFLPKKTRNESVHLRLSLHFGDARKPAGLQPRSAGFLPELMTRGTKDLTRQQTRRPLDKNFVRLGTGMKRGTGIGRRPRIRARYLHDRDQTRTPRRRLEYASPGAPRAEPALSRIRGNEE